MTGVRESWKSKFTPEEVKRIEKALDKISEEAERPRTLKEIEEAEEFNRQLHHLTAEDLFRRFRI